jgi:hypothetical protein
VPTPELQPWVLPERHEDEDEDCWVTSPSWHPPPQLLVHSDGRSERNSIILAYALLNH